METIEELKARRYKFNFEREMMNKAIADLDAKIKAAEEADMPMFKFLESVDNPEVVLSTPPIEYGEPPKASDEATGKPKGRRHVREDEIEAAGEHAEAVSPGWRDEAVNLMVKFAQQVQRPFILEEARKWMSGEGLEDPPTFQAWGTVALSAARKGFIKQMGYQKAEANGRPVTLWQVA